MLQTSHANRYNSNGERPVKWHHLSLQEGDGDRDAYVFFRRTTVPMKAMWSRLWASSLVGVKLDLPEGDPMQLTGRQHPGTN